GRGSATAAAAAAAAAVAPTAAFKGGKAWMAAGEQETSYQPPREVDYQHQQQSFEQTRRSAERGRPGAGKDSGLLSAAADLAALKGASPLKPPRPAGIFDGGQNNNGNRRRAAKSLKNAFGGPSTSPYPLDDDGYSDSSDAAATAAAAA
ncbi:unnamed protein product, partial [Scytosiphon promiscuus]